MPHYRMLLISVLLLAGCTSEHSNPISRLASVKHATDSQPYCAESSGVLSCDWNNVTDDWDSADPAEFSEHTTVRP
ncbi:MULTISPECIES: hypothetical protein [Lelliottia]|uniref:hypothetical protein n=1 Tax=Lelliottia TaxID=1330545 RepID=UPI0010573634|nr:MULTISPECIES: hypothetical protein [Lelliottia]